MLRVASPRSRFTSSQYLDGGEGGGIGWGITIMTIKKPPQLSRGNV